MQRSTSTDSFDSVPLAALRLGAVRTLHDQARSMGLDWLSTEERQRLEEMRSDRRKEQFLAGHWLARCLAAHVLGGEPLQWTLCQHASGAPYLRAPRGIDASKHSISVSHCADRVAVAMACFPVGVDMQTHKARNFLGLAALVFPAELQDELAGLDAALRERCFYQRWSIKEAVYKRAGSGPWPKTEAVASPIDFAADGADVLAWQFNGFSLALAGSTGMTTQANVVLPAASYWCTDGRDHDSVRIRRKGLSNGVCR